MDRRKHPGTPDDMLPLEVEGAQAGLNLDVQEALNNKSRIPFVSIPNLISFAPDPMVEVTQQDVARITTTNLVKILYSEGRRSVDKVALNAAEYGRIAIHLPTLLDRAEAPASKKYEFANPIIRREHELKRRRDTLRDMGPKHKEMIEGFDAEIDNLRTLLGYARSPYLPRAGNARTREMVASAWKSIDNLLQVAGDKGERDDKGKQHPWTPEQRAGAREAMLRALFTGRPDVRLAEWKRVLPLAYDYARRKRYIYADRYDQIQTMGQQVTGELTEFLGAHGFTA